MKEIFDIPKIKLGKEWKNITGLFQKMGAIGATNDNYIACVRNDGLTITMTFQREKDGTTYQYPDQKRNLVIMIYAR